MCSAIQRLTEVINKAYEQGGHLAPNMTCHSRCNAPGYFLLQLSGQDWDTSPDSTMSKLPLLVVRV